MTCRREQEYIESYIMDDLAPELADLLEAHLRACDACRRRYEEQKRLIALLKRAFRARQRLSLRDSGGCPLLAVREAELANQAPFLLRNFKEEFDHLRVELSA
ncbi:MAG: anti-sigma factor family protein [Fimbriimonadales bacterium]